MKRFFRILFLMLLLAAATPLLTMCASVGELASAPAASLTAAPEPSPTIALPSASPTAAVQVTAAPTVTPSATPTVTPSPTPTPAPTATPSPEEQVKIILESMSDEELLGQMVMLGFRGTEDMPEEIAELYRKHKVGGVMLFGWNVKSFDQAKKMIAKLNGKNPTPDLPLFIAIDEEGGAVKRFVWKPYARSAATLGRRNNPKEVYEQFLRVGKKLHETGINLNFAPVLDIAPNPPETFLNTRMYGSDPKKVIPMTNAVIKGLHDAGIFSLGKHFPGHGNTADDSHLTLPVIQESRKQLNSYALKPFAAAIENGIDAMLVGHLLVPALDHARPASLSPKVITGLLRKEMGFQGVIFSDDMRMGAITSNYNIGEACVQFIEAGGDVLLIGKFTDKQTAALAALQKAVKSGRITRERLMESAYRIIKLKLKIKESFSK